MRRLILAACLMPTLALAQPRITVLTAEGDPMLTLPPVSFQGGRTLNLSVGIGSAANWRPGDSPNIVHFLADRGPNIACSDAEAITGVARAQICAADPGGRLYPLPGYAPALYGVRLDEAAGRFRVFEAVAIKRTDGTPLTGLTNPLAGRTETPMDANGQVLPFDAGALDMEGLLRLPDGRFWVGEENAPSIAEIAPDGTVIRRIVPDGTEAEFANAGYPVQGGLPAILARRQSNRGIESMAGDPRGQALYFILQNPLANPNAAAYRAARNVRLLRFDPAAGRTTGEWVYRMDAPQSFRLDPSDNQTGPRISELTWLGPDRLLVLERTDRTTKLYEVRLDQGATNILGTPWDAAATSPSLEQTLELDGSGIIAVTKRLVFDSADHPEAPGKLEGVALLPGGTLLMVNDDDFGITGESTRILLIRGLDLTW